MRRDETRQDGTKTGSQSVKVQDRTSLGRYCRQGKGKRTTRDNEMGSFINIRASMAGIHGWMGWIFYDGRDGTFF